MVGIEYKHIILSKSLESLLIFSFLNDRHYSNFSFPGFLKFFRVGFFGHSLVLFHRFSVLVPEHLQRNNYFVC